MPAVPHACEHVGSAHFGPSGRCRFLQPQGTDDILSDQPGWQDVSQNAAPHQPYEGFVPDIMMKNGDSIDLQDFGVDGFARHTGSHTPGSIVVELSSQEILVGDLIASGILIGGIAFTGHAIRPPFEVDPQTVARELQRMVHGGAKRFYMGHGGPLEAVEVMRHARSMSKLVGLPCRTGSCAHS